MENPKIPADAYRIQADKPMLSAFIDALSSIPGIKIRK
jgi:hypothetical protein